MIDHGCASAPVDTANSNTAEAPIGPSRCSVTSMPNNCLLINALMNIPAQAPKAARDHSAGWVLREWGMKLRKSVFNG